MAGLVVRGASVLTLGGWATTDLVIDDGRVAGEASAGMPQLLADGLLAAPGFVDLQCNGGLGIDLAREPERLWELGAALPRWGITAWLPTIVTTVPAIVERALAALGAGPPPGWAGATPLGLHLEGPFLSRSKRGAHADALLRPPTADAVAHWSRAEGVAVVTLAPELPGALEVIHELTGRGVVVSLGHSAATAGEARAAIDAGATWVTHVFNAMAPLHHREPGLVGVALVDERLRVGLIADGIHVHTDVVTLVQRAVRERLTLVTDAVGAFGLPAGQHGLGSDSVAVDDAGAVRLADGTLAGAACSMDAAVRNLVRMTGCAPDVALCAASAAPAAVLGDEQRGALRRGCTGDVVLLTPELEVVATIVGGAVVHRSGLLQGSERSARPTWRTKA